MTILQHRFDSPQVKQSLISRKANKLLHELPNGLRLKISGNYEILEKSQIWLENKTLAIAAKK